MRSLEQTPIYYSRVFIFEFGKTEVQAVKTYFIIQAMQSNEIHAYFRTHRNSTTSLCSTVAECTNDFKFDREGL
jgi:hypothetical protein